MKSTSSIHIDRIGLKSPGSGTMSAEGLLRQRLGILRTKDSIPRGTVVFGDTRFELGSKDEMKMKLKDIMDVLKKESAKHAHRSNWKEILDAKIILNAGDGKVPDSNALHEAAQRVAQKIGVQPVFSVVRTDETKPTVHFVCINEDGQGKAINITRVRLTELQTQVAQVFQEMGYEVEKNDRSMKYQSIVNSDEIRELAAKTEQIARETETATAVRDRVRTEAEKTAQAMMEMRSAQESTACEINLMNLKLDAARQGKPIAPASKTAWETAVAWCGKHPQRPGASVIERLLNRPGGFETLGVLVAVAPAVATVALVAGMGITILRGVAEERAKEEMENMRKRTAAAQEKDRQMMREVFTMLKGQNAPEVQQMEKPMSPAELETQLQETITAIREAVFEAEKRATIEQKQQEGTPALTAREGEITATLMDTGKIVVYRGEEVLRREPFPIEEAKKLGKENMQKFLNAVVREIAQKAPFKNKPAPEPADDVLCVSPVSRG